jgi:prevent-host-death family protein
MAERVGVRELRQNLSRWLRRVEAGETFEVTERGEPVALLAPLPGQSGPLRRLTVAGRLAQVGSGLESLDPPPAGTSSISEALEELRGERI